MGWVALAAGTWRIPQRVTWGHRRKRLSCPPGGSDYPVWGGSPPLFFYTDDSSICTAAVHDGTNTFASGGLVYYRNVSGLGGYTGSTQDGVTSGSWEEWPGSFVLTQP